MAHLMRLMIPLIGALLAACTFDSGGGATPFDSGGGDLRLDDISPVTETHPDPDGPIADRAPPSPPRRHAAGQRCLLTGVA